MSRLKPIVCSDRGSHTARYAKSARMAVALCPILLFGSPDRASAADWLDDTGLRGSLAPVGYTRWDGWNAGVQAGLSNMNTDFGNSTGPLVAFILRNTTIENEFAPSNWTTLPANSTRGELFGGFIGYNMQWEQLVIGFDFAYKYMSGLESSAADSIARQVHTTADNFDNTVDIDARSTVKLLDYATLRARAGYAYGQFLPYALVGAVAGRFNYATTVTVHTTGTPLGAGVPFDVTQTSTSGKNNAVVGGVAAGLGVDWAITPNVFLRAEWEYVAFAPLNGARINLNTGQVGAGLRF